MADIDAAELEHIIGFAGQRPHCLDLHPRDSAIVLHGIGHVVVLADQTDPHKQDLLRGHDNEVACVTFSASGRILASGQIQSAHRDGEQICKAGGVLKRFIGAQGSKNGNDMVIWDMQNGSIAQYIK
eukprot:1459644-Rhodomonas_salina.3